MNIETSVGSLGSVGGPMELEAGMVVLGAAGTSSTYIAIVWEFPMDQEDNISNISGLRHLDWAPAQEGSL